MEWDSQERAEEPSHAVLLQSGALHFPLSWTKSQQKQEQQAVLPAPLQQAGQEKTDPGKRKLICQFFSIAIKIQLS